MLDVICYLLTLHVAIKNIFYSHKICTYLAFIVHKV